MAISVNKVILVGRLGRDPEAFGKDQDFAKFSLATSEYWTKDGEREERTQWHNVVIWNPAAAKYTLKNMKKGDQAYVEGQVETRKYEKDGRDVHTTEIVVRPYTGSVQSVRQGGRGGGQQEDDREETQQETRREERHDGRGGFSRDLDDEIPF